MNDIYVYDKEKYFAVFLRKKLSKKYCIINLNDVKLMKSENFKDTNVGLFIANNVNDIVAFFRFRECFNEKIILCSENVSVTEKYSKTFQIPCLDISRPKKHFYKDLNNRIEIMFMNSTSKFI